MKEHIVLIFDIGSQSTRALLINQLGEILVSAKNQYETAYTSPNPDWAEQDADFYYNHICDCANKIRTQHPNLWNKIKAVSLTTIRDSVVCLDEENKPLRPAILWLDKRLASGKPKLSPINKLIFKSVGMLKTVESQFKKSYCNWISQNEPQIWEKTSKYVLLGTYLTYKMTGKLTDSAANMVGHIPFDHKKRTWQSTNSLVRPVFPIPQSKLPDIVESGSIIGEISESFAHDSGLSKNTIMIASGSDKACEVLGMGCVDDSQLALGLGTTATITFQSNKYLELERFIPPYASIISGYYNPEIEIFRGYWLISWFKKEFANHEVVQALKMGISAEELLNSNLRTIPPGCNGLLFQPYFTPNITMPNARGCIIGFSDVHTRLHIYRAIIEGINFALIDGMKNIEKRRKKQFTQIHIAGGGSQSSEICQITANMFGIPVKRMQSYEAAGLGCAIVSFVALGVFSDYIEAVKSMIHEKNVFEPDLEIHKYYQKIYNDIFQNIYPTLKHLYNRFDIYS